MIPEERDVYVINRDLLDPEFQALHPSPWLVEYPNGFIVYHETEDAACAHQLAHRATHEELI